MRTRIAELQRERPSASYCAVGASVQFTGAQDSYYEFSFFLFSFWVRVLLCAQLPWTHCPVDWSPRVLRRQCSLTIFTRVLRRKHWVLDLLYSSLALAPLAALELTVHISQASNLTLLFLPPGCWECKHVQAGWAVKRLHMWVCMWRSGGSFGVGFPQLSVDSRDWIHCTVVFTCSKPLYFMSCLTGCFCLRVSQSGYFGTHCSPVKWFTEVSGFWALG